jgi:hypothetical protein
MTEKDRLYLDILDGLSVYFDSVLIQDILKTVAAHPEPDLGTAFNHNQTASKTWLINSLHDAVGGDLGVVYVLGGWYGVLGALLLHDRRFTIPHLVSVDLEDHCRPVAESFNRTPLEAGRFSALTADMLELDYGASLAPKPDLLINTSCEHLDRFGDWYAAVPDGTVLVLQSNDFFDCDYHVNCVPNLAALQAQAPMTEVLFAGELETKNYVRFMTIGRK